MDIDADSSSGAFTVGSQDSSSDVFYLKDEEVPDKDKYNMMYDEYWMYRNLVEGFIVEDDSDQDYVPPSFESESS